MMTDCISRSPLSDETLSLVIDNLADNTTLQHLAQCVYCADQLEALRSFDTLLEQQLRRIDCPSPQELSDYDADILSNTSRAIIDVHLKDCSKCQQELVMLEQFLDTASSDETQLPTNIIPFRRPVWVLPVMPSTVEGSLALKGMDDENGEKSHDAILGTARVYLESHQISTGFRLTGQIIDSELDWSGAVAQLIASNTTLLITLLDDVCEFSFDVPNVSPLTLNITSEKGVMIVIENINLQD